MLMKILLWNIAGIHLVRSSRARFQCCIGGARFIVQPVGAAGHVSDRESHFFFQLLLQLKCLLNLRV